MGGCVKTAIVYKITNEKTGLVYVGQTIRTLRRRFVCHANGKTATPLREAIREYGRTSFSIEALEQCPLDVADEVERKWIAELNTIFPNGYNLQSGGNGSGKVFHELTRERIKKSWTTRAPMTDDTKKRMSLGQKKRMAEDPEFKKLRLSYLSKSRGHLKGKQVEHGSRKVVCLNTGQIFRTMTEAAKATGCGLSTVCAVARGKWPATKGYRFEYFEGPK